jgi:eukaryotic-like serine/threonine-protein kinase
METDGQTGTIRVETGSVLGGRYRLVARIGAGGMATIYRARDETLQRDVAVKVLHPHLAEDTVLQERFRVEARHAAALLHPNVVNVFDQGLADLPYIVMEHVDGPSLRDVLHAQGRLTPSQALGVLEPVCAALERAHGTGLVHRDIKPENVLLTPDGTPKVADFGIARAVAETTLTQTGTLVGSLHYMAPELLAGQEATPASDQYSLGVLLFELLTGRKAVTGDTPAAVAARHGRERIAAPSSLVSDVPRGLDRVVLRATAPEPGKRFADMAAMAQALRAAVPAGPQPVPLPIPGSNDDHSDTLVIPAAGQETVTVDAAKEVGKRHPTRRRSRRPLLLALAVALIATLGAGGAWVLWNYALAPLTAVPGVEGMSEAQAAALLDERGLQLDVSERVHRLEEPAGTILGQAPAEGAELRRGDSVQVIVSAGPEVVSMPGVIRMPAEEAVALLEGEGFHFTVRIDESWNDNIDAGLVAGQLPDPREPVEQGSPVVINVSLGIEQVTVPDLSGMDRAQAEAVLAEAQLAATFTEEWSDEVPEQDMVIRQSLDPGSEVDRDTEVAVTVSRGPRTIDMPNVRGKPIGDARSELEALHLQVRVVEQERPRIGPFRTGQFGRVEYQEPQPGESVRRGETVTLYTFSEAAEQDG